jgi:hypothetical protein
MSMTIRLGERCAQDLGVVQIELAREPHDQSTFAHLGAKHGMLTERWSQIVAHFPLLARQPGRPCTPIEPRRIEHPRLRLRKSLWQEGAAE